MRHSNRASVLLPAVGTACLLLSGCADFSVRKARSPEDPGLHFFMPKPYLLVWWERSLTVKSQTVLETVVPHFQILYLPDRRERYTVTQQVFLARGDFAYRLADGWRLEGINGEMDTTEVLRMLAKPAEAAAERAIPRAQAAVPLPQRTPLPPPALFELVWDEGNATYLFKPVKLPGFTDIQIPAAGD